MIDSRDYKTRDELADAMQLEHDISELDFLNKTLTSLEVSFEFYKYRFELLIEEIKSKKLKLQNNIDEYYKKNKASSDNATYLYFNFRRYYENNRSKLQNYSMGSGKRSGRNL